MRHPHPGGVYSDAAPGCQSSRGAGILSTTLRAFFGIPVVEPAHHVVAELLATLRRRIDGVRWVRPEGLHLSLHFFGDIDETEAGRALDAVAPVVGATPAFDVAFGGLGAFAAGGHPRVLWLGVTAGEGELRRLAEDTRSALRRSGFPVDDRDFVAHCTLGRPRPGWPAPARRVWERIACPAIPSCRVERVVLYESRPQPGGAVYVERASLPLTG